MRTALQSSARSCACLLGTACFASLLATTRVHAQQPATAVPTCGEPAVLFTLRFYAAPEHVRVVALNYENHGDAPCQLPEFRKQDGYPVVTVVPGQRNAEGIPAVLQRSTEGAPAYLTPSSYPHEVGPPRTVLAPGGSAHSSFRYNTEPVPGERCWTQGLFQIIAATGDGSITIGSRALAPTPCGSLLDDTGYHPGLFLPDWPTPPARTPTPPPPPELTIAKSTYFEHERLFLHATLADRTARDPSCPVLLRSARDARNHLSIQEVVNPEPLAFEAPIMAKILAEHPYFLCHNRSPWTLPYNQFDLPVSLGNGASLNGLGRHSFAIIQLAGPAPDGEFIETDSREVTADVVSAVDIPRAWGKPAAGVRIDLTLDKADYAVGEDVPLHIATEDLAAAGTVFDAPPTGGFGVQWSFPPSLSFLVEGEHGPLTPSQLMMFGGPVACPDPYSKGTVVPHELQLSDAGYSFTEPGTYRITALWKPYASASGKCESRQLLTEENGRLEENKTASTPFEPFTTVASTPVTIHIH